MPIKIWLSYFSWQLKGQIVFVVIPARPESFFKEGLSIPKASGAITVLCI
jgi:hypothetical protein